MKMSFDPRLYLVTDRRFCERVRLEDVVLMAVKGGATAVQLREKHLNPQEFVELACALKKRLLPFQIPLIINDSVEVAKASGAHGIHLGPSDLSPFKARALLGETAWIGLSVENLEQLRSAPQHVLDYVAASPVFSTATKTDTAPALGLSGLEGLRKMTALPLIGIGGIHPSNVSQVIQAGADGIAVVSAIMAQDNPESAAKALRGCVERALRERAAV